MELSLKQEKINCYSPVYSDMQRKEETAESVVPDTMPDIARILDMCASVYVRSKELREGAVTVDAVLRGTVLYIGEEDSGLQRLELELPCLFSWEREDIGLTDKPVLQCYVNYTDARALNPRKILFRAEAAAALCLYRESVIAYASSLEEGVELETLIREETVSYTASVAERSFTVSDELSLPAARPSVEKLLRYQAFLTVEDTKPVGAKVIVQGSAQLEVLYQPSGGNDPIQERFTVPFSQIMDQTEAQNSSCSPVLLPLSCTVETLPGAYGAAVLHFEMQVLAQNICRVETVIRCIADAYSTKAPAAVQTVSCEMTGAVRPNVFRETLRELLELPDNAVECLSVSASASMPEREEDRVTTAVCVRALYTTERGRLAGVGKTLTVTLAQELPAAEEEILWAPGCAEPYISPVAGGMELRLPMEWRAERAERKTLEAVGTVELDEDAAPAGERRPSLYVVRPGDRSLWELAKKYRSTVARIEAANPGPRERDSLLLIPRVRKE